MSKLALAMPALRWEEAKEVTTAAEMATATVFAENLKFILPFT